MSISYDIIFLSYKRPEAICKAVKYAATQTPKPNEILVWHNHPSKVKIADATNIYSERNYGCQVRHAIALMSLADVVIFVDDEFFLKSPHCCQLLVEAIERKPYSIVGYEGRILADNQQPYSTGTDTRDGPCSMMKGVLHAVNRRLLPCPFFYDTNILRHDGLMVEDDIVFSASVMMKTGCHPIAIPFPKDWIDRDPCMRDEHAVCTRENHMQRRDEACLHMINLGWRPFR